MSHRPDLIEEYLSELRSGLRLAPAEAALILAEAEDHLRETEACGLATGMTGPEAQQAAISAFGSVSAVARAHGPRPGDLIRGRTPQQYSATWSWRVGSWRVPGWSQSASAGWS